MDTRLQASAPGTAALVTNSPAARLLAVDPLEQLETARRADAALLRLVGCAAAATLLLAVVGHLVS